ncbi:tape measure protein [uncultured Gilliamella sp.]|uniref:tape measure protein n=1 Tax=uncultured Gilliamella sp. TaxID=1193505 RepID=UPI0025F5937C|nr:tape measure protein [uncultured Gilliamella sp.]
MAQYTEGNITYTVSLEMKELLENSRKIMQEMKELNNSGSKASKVLEKLESSAQSAGNSLGKLTNIAKAVSAALVSSTVIAYAQSWNELEDRIQNTGAKASQTKDILDQLLVTSDRNGRTIEETSGLYIRLSNSMGELGYSTQSTISYIDTLSNLMTINKTNSLSAESATNALTKAQMKGKLAGVEAMTVFNAMPSILKTLGKQLNKTEAEVRKMASDGKLSMSEFTEAMIAAREETAALADNMRNTVTEGY